MLLLFDIDGTLLRCGGAGRIALNAAFEERYGAVNVMENIRLAGGTDYAILEEIFESRFQRLATDDEQERTLNCYLRHLKRELRVVGDRFEVLPGVLGVLDHIQSQQNTLVGLATGNVESGARIKLEHAQLSERFGFGGFGSDAKTRAGLIRVAVRRADRLAELQWGYRFQAKEIFVIGDTEFDVRSAHELGFYSIGVRAGSLDVGSLEEANPTVLVDSLEDPEFWAALEIDPA